MTKTELLAIIDDRTLVMKDPVLSGGYPIDLTDGYSSDYETLSYYTVKVMLETNTDAVTDTMTSFWVFDEGLPTEDARWPVSEQFKPREITPERLLKEYLDTFVGGAIKSYTIRAGSLNVNTRTALVDVLWSDNTFRLYLVSHNGTEFELEQIS